MSKTARRRGLGYVRVSRRNGREGDSYIAKDVQRETIRRAAEAAGIRIVGWHVDEDESGATLERPAMQAAFEAVEDREASVIVVARLTRFARSVLETHRGLERLEKVDGQLLACDMPVDTTTPQGKMMRGLLAVLAQFELDVIREQWSTATGLAVARGVKISSVVPFGYLRGADKRLEADPVTGPLVGELFRRRGAGLSWAELSAWLEAEHGLYRRPHSIRSMIASRAYVGEVVYGELVQEGAHPALVSEDEWRAAQSAPAPGRRARGEGSLLAGILHCSGCGRPMTTGSASQNGETIPTYRCKKHSKDGRCAAPMTVTRSRADAHVEALFLAWAGGEAAEGEGRGEAELELAAQALAACEAELASYLRTGLADVVGVEAFRLAAEERQAAVDAARAELERVRRTHHVEALRVTVADTWPELGLADRRRLLAAAIERITVHPSPRWRAPFAERAELVWRGASPPAAASTAASRAPAAAHA